MTIMTENRAGASRASEESDPIGEIPQMMDRLHATIGYLHEQISALTTRLTGVIRPVPPETAEKSAATCSSSDPCVGPLLGQLTSATATVDHAIERLSELVNRVEL